MENEEHYFYVLSCKDGSLYAGYTNDLKRRIKLHNEGKGAKYTRGKKTGKAVFISKGFPTKSEAMKAEYAFKQLDRKKKIQYLIKEGAYVATEKL